MDVQLRFLMEAHVNIAPALEIGETAKGRNRVIPITGGTFEGPQLKGTVLSGGADWQLIRTDGVAEVVARYTLKTDDGALISVVNRGFRHGPPEIIDKLYRGESVDPSSYYFRTTPIFEVAAEKYAWLTKHIFIGVGRREPTQVIIKFFQVL